MPAELESTVAEQLPGTLVGPLPSAVRDHRSELAGRLEGHPAGPMSVGAVEVDRVLLLLPRRPPRLIRLRLWRRPLDRLARRLVQPRLRVQERAAGARAGGAVAAVTPPVRGVGEGAAELDAVGTVAATPAVGEDVAPEVVTEAGPEASPEAGPVVGEAAAEGCGEEVVGHGVVRRFNWNRCACVWLVLIALWLVVGCDWLWPAATAAICG